MTFYPNPDLHTLAAELARAGADENGQVAGALWIAGALRGIALSKATAGDAERLRKIKRHLDAAVELLNAAPAPWHQWLAEDVNLPVERASRAVEFALSGNPGGQREKAHSKFARALRRYFEGEGLPVSFGESSPFVAVFSHCTNMDADAARITLSRLG